ncbi:hypothetical protein BSBH6_01136 [Bacillus subtilis]|nr:hypothetical protein BSBH6_01136 [Bacillus subtilis]RPK18440.1 hypothetical protein BH5_01133 [Bacillus subtilis]
MTSSFFFRLDHDRDTEICYYATGWHLITFEHYVTYKKEADHYQPLFSYLDNISDC